ncbi:MAG: YiiX/YebB-like N1pC/P60 family cysteine hydrolase [Phycisphaerae bacterium]|nr:YiiX/YebB-like N1pC/P60 family cysteine hydrolase [Phycisphaerae bacterium]
MPNATAFHAAARTVTAVADHVEQLKHNTLAMKAEFATGDRGYFTPSEDEQVRHLLVSYVQSRNALFEVIDSLRRHPGAMDEDQPELFAAGYAAAIVLVDAARFLRELYDDDPIVIGKLNAAEPNFGIPEGTYDGVQKSLTDPLHAWHLYEANAFFEKCAADLRTLCRQDPPLASVLDVIDRLRHRVDVRKRDYASARLRVRARQAADAVAHSAVGRAVYGIQEAVSRMFSHISTKPDHEPHLPPRICQELLGLLRSGDVLVTRKEYAVTNYFLPGYWPHVAFYLGPLADVRPNVLEAAEEANREICAAKLGAADPPDTCVLEALKDGVRLRDVESPFASDCLAVIRPQAQPKQIARAIARGLAHEGKPYDFDFDFTRSDRLVCTEVVYRSFEGLDDFRFDLTRRAGRWTLSAEDLLGRALRGDKFETVAVYCPAHGSDLQVGRSATDAVIGATVQESS